jgi:hypothetical protein
MNNQTYTLGTSAQVAGDGDSETLIIRITENVLICQKLK